MRADVLCVRCGGIRIVVLRPLQRCICCCGACCVVLYVLLFCECCVVVYATLLCVIIRCIHCDVVDTTVLWIVLCCSCCYGYTVWLCCYASSNSCHLSKANSSFDSVSCSWFNIFLVNSLSLLKKSALFTVSCNDAIKFSSSSISPGKTSNSLVSLYDNFFFTALFVAVLVAFFTELLASTLSKFVSYVLLSAFFVLCFFLSTPSANCFLCASLIAK